MLPARAVRTGVRHVWRVPRARQPKASDPKLVPVFQTLTWARPSRQTRWGCILLFPGLAALAAVGWS